MTAVYSSAKIVYLPSRTDKESEDKGHGPFRTLSWDSVVILAHGGASEWEKHSVN